MKITLLSIGTLLCVAITGAAASAATLEVGPDKPFARIEAAYEAAEPGDVILVHPREDNAPYKQVALFINKPRITFRGVQGPDDARVKINGEGFDYSGRGSTPRAVFQFNRGADHGLVENFEVFGASNDTHNGAGFRINQANHVTIRNCEVHHNDMGMQSNSDGTMETAVNQLIEHCIFRDNGDERHPGYDHNLYVGGTSVTMRFSEVYGSLTGHNFKSRAHYNRIEYCYTHDAANREIDLVDGRDTERSGSHAVLIGNIIVKDPQCPGNRAVIHFGQDGGREHDGTLYLIHNTIVTPFHAPVVDLSTPRARAHLLGNIVFDAGASPREPALISARNGADRAHVSGTHNWLSAGFTRATEGTELSAYVAKRDDAAPPFADAARRDYRLVEPVERITGAALPPEQTEVPPTPGAERDVAPLSHQYKHPAGGEPRGVDGRADLGAYGSGPE